MLLDFLKQIVWFRSALQFNMIILEISCRSTARFIVMFKILLDFTWLWKMELELHPQLYIHSGIIEKKESYEWLKDAQTGIFMFKNSNSH